MFVLAIYFYQNYLLLTSYLQILSLHIIHLFDQILFLQNKLNPIENKMLALNKNKLNSNTIALVLKTQEWFSKMHGVFTEINFYVSTFS